MFASNFFSRLAYIDAPTSLVDPDIIVTAAPANAEGWGSREGSDLVTGLVSMCSGAPRIRFTELKATLRVHVANKSLSEMYRNAKAQLMNAYFSPSDGDCLFLGPF